MEAAATAPRRLPALFDPARFVTEVRAYMGRQRLSLDGLAFMVEVSSAALHDVLQGRVVPDVVLAAQLADLCDLSLDAFRRPI